MLTTLYLTLLVSLLINSIMFLIAFRLKSDKLTDASYAISFIALAVCAYASSPKTMYAAIAVVLVSVWALRIGSFLLYRVIRAGKDQRFDAIRGSFSKFAKFWLGQAITVWILMLPVMLATQKAVDLHSTVLVGVLIWLVGFCLEAIADLQKYRFNEDPSKKGKWIDTGIWQYSRHPNYFGEILVWFGMYAYAFSNLALTGKIIGAASPVFITILLLFVSGIPILEKSADKRWGNDLAYRAYKKRTSILIPLPKRNA